MKLEYSTDICGNQILQDETGKHQVMMEWEKPYMEKCIEYLNPSGSVLEIGFGLGYSASKLCSYKNVTKYSVIECCPEVWKKFYIFKQTMNELRPELEVNLIKGRWEDILVEIGIFDSIFFDDYNGTVSNESKFRFNKFLYELIANGHSKIGSKICVYSNAPMADYKISSLIQKSYEYLVDIPIYCTYAKGNKMYIPLIIQTKKICGAAEFQELVKELKDKLLNPPMPKKIQEQIEKAKKYFTTQKSAYCNIMVIDDFYINAKNTRDYILKQEFKVRNNYVGQQTTSHATIGIKDKIENYIQSFAGKITHWSQDNSDLAEISNGAFHYTTSAEHAPICSDISNNWIGILYMTPNAPVSSGLGIYKFKDGTRSIEEAEARGNKRLLELYKHDSTKWELIDKIGNIFNRLVLFNAKQYSGHLDYFGVGKEDGQLFQVFHFSTEK